MTRNKLALSLAGLLLAPIAGAAFAQTTTPTTSQDQTQAAPDQSNTKQLQTITVTGSALPRVDTETPSPVTVITAQQIARSGFTTISDVVRSISADNSGSLPTAFAAAFAAGSSGIALRGLTVNSTLVLIDGKRLASYPLSDDGERSFVDLNTIPIASVERIEVLKDGASSIYGADAIAGVVNIIMKKTFHGVEGTADIGNSQHGGGFTKKATFLAGGGDLDTDHYNAYFSAQYEQDNTIYNRDRSFPFNTQDLSSLGGFDLNAGQGTNTSNNPGSVTATTAPGTLSGPGGFISGVQQVNGSSVTPMGACASGTKPITNSTGNYCEQNLVGEYGQVQPETKNGGLYGRATFKINDTTQAYVSLSYMDQKTYTSFGTLPQIQTSTPNNTNGIALPPYLANGQVNPNNPYMTPGNQYYGDYAIINYAFPNLGQQGADYDNQNVRLVSDISGTWGEWNYEGSVAINHDKLDVNEFGFLSYPALYSAINNGTYNFVNPSATPSSVLASLAPNVGKASTSDMDVVDFDANRELFDLPGGSAGLALGAQGRYEAQHDTSLNPDDIYQGLGIAQTEGHRDVGGIYSELDMPLLESLEVDASGRFDHYSDVGNNFSPKVGFKWKPLDWVAVRGTYSKGFRAPSFAENGSSSAEGFINYTPPPSFAAEHGGNAYGTAPYSLAEYSVANPNIKPEKARNFTFGVVIQPTSWLNASLDYYNIVKSNVIVGPDYGDAINEYYSNNGVITVPGVKAIPDLADPQFPNALPKAVEFIGEYTNANYLKTDGIDLDLQANFDLGGGFHYTSEIQGTQIFEWYLVEPNGSKQTYVGTQGPYNLSSGAGTPRTKGSWSNTIQYGPWTGTLTAYYTSGQSQIAEDVGFYPGTCLSTNADGDFFPSSCSTSSFTVFDLTGSYAINDHITVTGSIMNLFDRNPPFNPANYAGTNYNPTYAYEGIVGRFWNLGVKVKF
jgi:iron complex outermembrane recepter protein